MTRHAFVDLETIASSKLDLVWDSSILPSYKISVHEDGKIEILRTLHVDEHIQEKRRTESMKRILLAPYTPVTIGRSHDAHIWIPEESTGGTFVSRRHGELLCERAGDKYAWSYKNLKTLNGTYVGEAWLRNEGDTIRLEAPRVILGIPKQAEPLTYALKVKLDLRDAF